MSRVDLWGAISRREVAQFRGTGWPPSPSDGCSIRAKSVVLAYDVHLRL